MSMPRLLKVLLVGVSAISVSACVSLLPEVEPAAIYRLSSPAPAEWLTADGAMIEINVPNAPRGLSSDNIAVLTAERHLAYMGQAKWIAPAPRVVQNLIIDSFNAADGQLVPARPSDGVRAQYELQLDLREFEASYDQGNGNAPTVRVRIAARLVSSETHGFIGTRVFSAQARASADRQQAIVDAFNRAAGDAAREMANWSIATVAH
jgi:cholesterol transport system auxiliary component